MMNIFLGNPPENIKQWIIADYNRKTPLCFEAVDSGETIALKCNGNNLKTATFQTSTDGQNWSDYTYATNITLANAGDKVYFKAKTDNTSIVRNSSNYLQFTTTQPSKKVKASGNVMSLLAPDFKDLIDLSTIRSGKPGTYQFYRLFNNCENINDSRNLTLPATTLADRCYQYMFYNCIALTQAPALPATTLADGCYDRMLQGCTSLTQARALPATTLASSCYYSMFQGCTSLTQAPALPATTLASICYNNMFYGCSNLTQAPALPATTLASSCYSNMFYDCTSLTQAPALPATTLSESCYSNMFSGCSNLTQAPNIKTYTSNLYAFENMLSTFDSSTGKWGKLTICTWPDLTLSEAESIVLNETIFGYDNPGSDVRISITCKDGNAIAYYNSENWTWVFEH